MPIEDLTALLPEGSVSVERGDRLALARDWWALGLLQDRRGDPPPLPAAVVRPGTVEEVACTLEWAAREQVPVVPYGGGSGVCGGAWPARDGITLDLRRLDRVLAIDSEALTVRAQAGIMGPALEGALAAHGLTLGHFPQSIEISTLGGWLAARGAGQKSGRYGRVEDMLRGVEVVLPGGQVIRTPAPPATAAGPDVARLFVGSEGTLGVITEATLAVWAAPAEVRHAAFAFPSFEAGLRAVQAVTRTGLRPAVMRLYDPDDTALAFRSAPEAPDGCALILRIEGHDLAGAEEAAVRRHLVAAGGRDLGDRLADWWWEHRNAAVETYRALMRGEVAGPTAIAETLEVAAAWPEVPAVYRSVRAAIGAHADLVACHASHAYPQGSCLYFTFLILGAPDDAAAEERYRAAWAAGLDAALAGDATVSHHHGVGIAKAPWAAREWGAAATLLRMIKGALDPGGIMNPGVLGLGRPKAGPEATGGERSGPDSG